MRWRLVLSVKAGDRTAEVHQIDCDDLQCSIGRGSGDLRLGDPRCSRKHAELYLDGQGGCGLRDLGSRNGTFVNGVRLGDSVLHAGDRISIGDTQVFLIRQSLIVEGEGAHDGYVRQWPGLSGCRPSDDEDRDD